MTENNSIPPVPQGGSSGQPQGAPLPPPVGAASPTGVPPVPPLPPGPGGAPVMPYASGYPGAYAGPPPDADARLWGMIAHLSALVQFVGVPTFVGPLVVWLIKKNDMPFVDDQAKDALNFQLTMLIVAIAATPLICIGIGLILLLAVGVVALVFAIIGGIKANEGVAYRYPMTIRMIK